MVSLRRGRKSVGRQSAGPCSRGRISWTRLRPKQSPLPLRARATLCVPHPLLCLPKRGLSIYVRTPKIRSCAREMARYGHVCGRRLGCEDDGLGLRCPREQSERYTTRVSHTTHPREMWRERTYKQQQVPRRPSFPAPPPRPCDVSSCGMPHLCSPAREMLAVARRRYYASGCSRGGRSFARAPDLFRRALPHRPSL